MMWPKVQRTGPGWVSFTLAVVAGLGTTARAPGAAPDPRALLQRVEEARGAIKSGRLELVVTRRDNKFAKHTRPPTRLAISFEGDNRRFDQFTRESVYNPEVKDGDKRLAEMDYDIEALVRAGLATFRDAHIRTAYDGTRLLSYTESGGAYVKDPKEGSGYYVFDPRILGISVYQLISTTVPNYLAYRDAKSVALIGNEEVAGHRAWHVRVLDKHDQEKHFWIGESADHPVYKSERISRYTREVATSEYDGRGAGGPLPVRVRTIDYDRDGKQSRETTITLEKAEYNIPVDPKAWTLAGLGMPLGEMVIDQRIHRVVGHFDGEKLTPRLPDAIRKGQAARWKPLHWGMAVSGLVIAAALAATFLRRRNLPRAED
jgi:hypothetical protein